MFNIQVFRKGNRISRYKSLQTNGAVTNGYASFPSISAYGTFGDFTVEFWLNKAAWDVSFARIIDFSFSSGFAIDRSSSTNKLNFQILNANFVSTTDLPENTWIHIACVRSGTTGFIYFNGTQDATGVVNGGTFAYTVSSNFGVGVNLSTSVGNERQTFKMTDLRIWKEARSQPQISANMNTHMTGTETNLIGNWQFIEGALTDSTSNNNTMVLQSAASISTSNPYTG